LVSKLWKISAVAVDVIDRRRQLRVGPASVKHADLVTECD
jgi:hypothetical protein